MGGQPKLEFFDGVWSKTKVFFDDEEEGSERFD